MSIHFGSRTGPKTWPTPRSLDVSPRQVLQANFAKPELGLNLEIAGLQLREVDLPDDFDDEIENTQEQMQEAT